MRNGQMTLYKYISTEHADDILNKKELLVSDGTTFNDPFELKVLDKRSGTESSVSGLWILCLTTSCKNKLMWSHYADSHKGLCLVVKVPKALVYPVHYSSRRIFTDSNIDGILKSGKAKQKKYQNKYLDNLSDKHKIALIKDKKWSYEKEWRLIFDKDDDQITADADKHFFNIEIERVYLGCRFEENEEDTKKKILSACESNKIVIQKMYLSRSSYAVEAEKVTQKGKGRELVGV